MNWVNFKPMDRLLDLLIVIHEASIRIDWWALQSLDFSNILAFRVTILNSGYKTLRPGKNYVFNKFATAV